MHSKIFKILDNNITIILLNILFLLSLIISITAIIKSPPDYLQNWYVLILYLHVPSSWFALALYSAIIFISLLFLITKEPFLDLLAYAIAPIGLCYTLISLITGSLWGKPAWGTFWVWDARLTSMLLQLVIYIIYITLQNNNAQHPLYKARICAYFAVVTLINIPVIKFSVYIWNTLHQKSSIITTSGPKMDVAMLLPLFSIFLTFCFFSLLIIILNVRTAILKKKLWRPNVIQENHH